MPQVSVILISYNAGQYLPQAVDSVLNQTFEDWELLLMDDGSTQESVLYELAVLEEGGDERVHVTRLNPSEEGRRASCRYASLINLAAQSARGEYVTYLAGDDWFMPTRLERMVLELGQFPPREVVYGSQHLYNEGIDFPFATRWAYGRLENAFELVDLNSVMHTMESFRKVGGWPDSPDIWRNADAHMWNRLTGAGYAFWPVPGEPTDCKRYREQSVDARVIRGETPWA